MAYYERGGNHGDLGISVISFNNLPEKTPTESTLGQNWDISVLIMLSYYSLSQLRRQALGEIMVIRNQIKVLKSNLCYIKIFAGLRVGAAKYLPCRYIRFGHFCEPVHLICEIVFLTFVNGFTRLQWDCGTFLDCNCCNMSGTPSFPVVTEFIKTKWRPGQHTTSLHLNLLSLPKLPSFGHVFFLATADSAMTIAHIKCSI